MATNYIYAYNKQRNTYSRYTAFLWSQMGKDKGGWAEISKEAWQKQSGDKSSTAKPLEVASTKSTAEYKTIFEQGRGFEKDGALAEALDRYTAAAEIKKTKTLTAKIDKLTTQVNQYKNLIQAGDEAMTAEFYTEAVEAYKAAKAIIDSPFATSKLAAAEQAVEDQPGNEDITE